MATLPSLLLFLFLQVDHAAEGRKALEAANHAAAAEHYRKAALADPLDWASRFHLGFALSMLDRDAEAAAAYREVLQAQPGLYQVQLNLGVVLLRRGQNEEAAKLLEQAAAQKPKEYRAIHYLAEARARLGDPRAEAGWRAALALDPQSGEAQVALARLLAAQQKLAEAEALYRQAAQLPEFRRALLELAGHFEKAGQPDKAAPLYREFPEDPAARERLGVLLLDGGKAGEAIPELEKAFRDSPTAANRLALATAHLRAKQPDKAAALLAQAVAAEPGNLELRLYHGRVLRDQRNYAAAAREFHEATRIQPDSKDAWNELTGMLILLDNHVQALAALDRAQALAGGESASHAWFRAMLYDKMKNYKAALPAYQRFLSLSQGKFPDEEFKARQRIRVAEKELGQAVTSLFLAAVFTLCPASGQDTLEAARAEIKLEKRYWIALEAASAAIAAARKSYQQGRIEDFVKSLERALEGVELSNDTLRATGKNPAKSPKHFKRAELRMRDILRRLAALEMEASVDDREPVVKVKARVNAIHDELLLDIMGRRK